MIFYIIFLVIFLLITIPSVYGFTIGAPIFFSPKKAIKEALKYCDATPGCNFFDLGMGTGRIISVAAKDFGAHVTGFELSPILFLISKINLRLHGVRNPALYLRNFYNQDLSRADIVFCFLTPQAMEKLRPKFQRELAPGARVISYAFHIEGLEPEKVIHKNYPGKVYIYKM